jgi:hypothetical protein
VAEKLDAALRHKLMAWLGANPALGLAAPTLAKEVPRLPFVLVTAVDEASATALVAAMRGLGLEAEWRRGGRLSLPQMRDKGWALTKRVALIGMTSVAYMMRKSVLGIGIGAALIGLGSLWSGFGRASRPVARLQSRRTRAALPSAMDAALARVADLVPAMSAARHRDALRGVVERALALRDVIDPAERAALDGQLAELVDHAALASSRLDQLEAELSPEDLRSGDEARRASWRIRDRWAARILQVTAFLDAMRARAVMAKARGAAQGDLDELRAHVAALAELEPA